MYTTVIALFALQPSCTRAFSWRVASSAVKGGPAVHLDVVAWRPSRHPRAGDAVVDLRGADAEDILLERPTGVIQVGDDIGGMIVSHVGSACAGGSVVGVFDGSGAGRRAVVSVV